MPPAIRDETVFDEDHVPVDVVHRHGKLQALKQGLERAVNYSQLPGVVSCFGPSGAGKTVSARYMCEEFAADRGLRTAHVDCWKNHASWPLLKELLDPIADTSQIRRRVDGTDSLVATLEEEVATTGYIAILDETDRMDDLDLLYELNEIPNLWLVLIANREEDLWGQVDDRLYSRLSTARSLTFDSYGVDELADIIADRARHGLDPDLWERDDLRQIADRVAGDARAAVRTLFHAAVIAGERDRAEFSPAILDEGYTRASKEIRHKTSEKLSPHERELYEVLGEHEELQAGDLHDAYEEAVENPLKRRQRRNILNKMEDYGLIESEGANRWKCYRILEVPDHS